MVGRLEHLCHYANVSHVMCMQIIRTERDCQKAVTSALVPGKNSCVYGG